LKEAYPKVIESDNFPLIRNFFVPTKANLSGESSDLPRGNWIPATGNNILSFGGTSYFFARKLFQEYKIPIGIINSSVGGTPIEAWMSRDAFTGNPDQLKKIDNFRDSIFMNNYQKRVNSSLSARPKPLPLVDQGLSGPVKWINPDFDASRWRKFWMPGYWADQGLRNLNGIFYFRKELQIPSGMNGKQAKLYIGRIIDADSVFLNGKFIGNTTYQYPPRRYVIPQGLLKTGKNILIVKVVSSSGKGGFVPDKNYFLQTASDEKIDLRGEWTYEVGYAQPRANRNFSNGGEMPLVAQNEPTGLFNTMVSPAVRFAIKGFVWYQGESNTGNAKGYAQLLPALIKDWRSKWKQGDLPFIYAQLPNFMEANYLPEESSWAEFRQSQLQALSLPNTGMAVSIDAGEWNDIHPLNKKAVGERLALWASHLAYGNKNIIFSGPIYKSNSKNESEVVINFDYSSPDLEIKGSGKLIGFELAGADKVFYWAEAKIVGNTVVLTIPSGLKPAFIRYAWADNPDRANLYNKAGLPASPFEAEVN